MRTSLAIPPGIVSDETTFSTPGYWADGNNVRPWKGRMQTIGGWSIAHGTALTGTCRTAFVWADLAGDQNIAFGTHSALQVLVGGTLYTITPSGLAAGNEDSGSGPGYGTGTYGAGGYGTSSTSEYYARTWSLSKWGENLIACPRGNPIYIWENNTGSLATEITAGPDEVTVALVTPSRQVMALGCNEEVSTTFNPMCIRFSDIEDYTDWTTATDNNAGEWILEGAGSGIVGAKLLGQYVAVWTDTGVHLGQFTGSTVQPWRFDLVATNCGLAGPNAVTVINGTAYWLTPDLQFYQWSPGLPPAPLNCQILNDFQDNIDTTQIAKVVCHGVTQFNEVWWHYPDSRDGDENSRYVAVSLFGPTWFRGQVARTAGVDSGPALYPLMVATDGYPYWHENGQSANGAAIDAYVQTSDVYLSEAERWFLIRGIWPDFEDQVGSVMMYVNLRNYPQGDETTKGPYSLTLSKDKYDFLTQGRIASLKFSQSSAPAFMRLGKPSYDIQETGMQ